MELEVRMAQHEMWEIVWRKVLPVFRRLLEDTKSPLGELAKELQAIRDLMEKARCKGWCGFKVSDPSQANKSGKRGGSQRGVFHFGDRNQRDYHEAVRNYHESIEQITNALLQYFTAEVKMRFRGRYRSGQRLDIRQAMQFQANPRLYDQLWQRISQPTRPDPAVVVLADASGSMMGERAHATFDVLVMLRESCLRLGLPLSILMFSSETHLVQDWNDPSSVAVLPRLHELRNNPDGGTDLAGGLKVACELLQQLPHRHRHFWLLSDGEPEDAEAAKRQLRVLKEHASSIIALGLGPDTQDLTQLVPSARTNLTPSQLPNLTKRLFAQMAKAA